MTTNAANDSYTKIRLISYQERDIIRAIIKRHCFGNDVTGSWAQQADGKICYHIFVTDARGCATYGKKLGAEIADSLGADEIYLMGIRM